MAGSEIGIDFAINRVETVAMDYVPTGSFLGDYGSIIIGVLIAIGIAYIILRTKKKTHKRKRKKISRKRKKR